MSETPAVPREEERAETEESLKPLTHVLPYSLAYNHNRNSDDAMMTLYDLCSPSHAWTGCRDHRPCRDNCASLSLCDHHVVVLKVKLTMPDP